VGSRDVDLGAIANSDAGWTDCMGTGQHSEEKSEHVDQALYAQDQQRDPDVGPTAHNQVDHHDLDGGHGDEGDQNRKHRPVVAESDVSSWNLWFGETGSGRCSGSREFPSIS
jgi:hypothetical protein